MKKKRVLCRIQLSFVLFILLGSWAHGQASRSSISGFVFDTERRPIAQVVVELQSEFSTIGRSRTDGSGRFFFRGLPQGRFTIRVLPLGTGYREQSEEVEIAGIGVRGQPLTDHIQKDIYLKRRPGADAVPFQNAVIYAQEVPAEAETLYKRALHDLDDEKLDAGLVGLEKAIDIFPTYFMALQRLGVARIAQQRYEDAAELFKRAVAVNDRSFDCWYGLAYALYSTRNLPEAVKAGEKAVEQRPDSIEANLLLGTLLRLTKSFAESERVLKQAAKIAQGSSADVHWQLALLYGKDMNKFAEAANQLEAYLEASPEIPNKDEIKKLIKQFKDKSKQKV